MKELNKNTNKFNVISIDKIEAPEGMSGEDWYHYTIGEGSSKIEGLRPGSLKMVTDHVNEYCHELNDRIGRGGSTYSPRAKQNTNK